MVLGNRKHGDAINLVEKVYMDINIMLTWWNAVIATSIDLSN